MALKSQALVRAFKYGPIDLPDPGAQYSLDQVRDFYSAMYPEITNAAIEGPNQKDGKLQYEFRKAVGTKGGEDERTLKTIAEQWQYFAQHDMHPAAPAIQTLEMQRAFSSGACAGLALALLAMTQEAVDRRGPDVAAHLEDMKTLNAEARAGIRALEGKRLG